MAASDLRPLSLGELLDHAFSYYRKHFLLFVGIMALPQAVLVGTNLALLPFRSFMTARPAAGAPATVAQISSTLVVAFISFGVVMIVFAMVYCVALGATTVALSEIHLGRETSIVGAYRSLQGKVLRLFDVVISVIIRTIGIYFLCVLAAIAIVLLPAIALGTQTRPNPVLFVILGLTMMVLFLAGMVLALFLVLRYSLAVPSLVLENLKAREAIRRSVTLAKGNLGRIFLTIILMYIINVVVAGVFQGPFWVVMIIAGLQKHAVPAWVTVPMYISGGIGGALAGPLMIIGLALLYYDARVRKEGYDLQLMMAGLNTATVAGGMSPPAVSPATPGN